MENIDQDILFYNTKKDEFEGSNMGKWILIHDKTVIGFYESFEKAADFAVKNFGSGPYLIRQIGATSVTLPISVIYNL